MYHREMAVSTGKGGLLSLPDWAWQRPDVRLALKTRDIGALLRSVQQYTGASQSRIAVAVGLLQGRVSEILRGNRTVTTLELFERIADGLEMPDDARMVMGLAPQHPAGLDHLSASGRAELLAVYPSQSAARAEIGQRAQDATAVDILAVRGLGIVGLNDSLLRSRIRKHATAVRAMLLDPDGEAARRRAAEIDETYGSFAAGIRLSIERLRDLAAEGGDIEVHVYDSLPTWRVIGLDATLFLSAFGETHEGHTSPMYKITGSPHGALHRGFHRFMEELRRTSRRVV
jgi:transcriptional regulator with XRE-family HTH domain